MTENRREQDFSAEKLLRVLQSYPPASNYLVGFSGGADSTALLHALSLIRARLDKYISAVHINHGLHHDAGRWQSHCQHICDRLDIHLHSISVEPRQDSGKGLEAEARRLRYQAIRGLLEEDTALLTAHHAEDQAETLFLQLMRGSGVDGLSAMPHSRPLGIGMLQRPLLGFSRSQLLQYLDQQHIEWIDDPSNLVMDHDRNYVRHQVMPMLEQRWPGITRRLLLTRNAMADARTVLERTADKALHDVMIHPLIIRLDQALVDDPVMLKLVIRRWAGKHSNTPLPAYKLEEFIQQLTNANSNQQPLICWDDWQIRLYQQQLWLIDSDLHPAPDLTFKAASECLALGQGRGRLIFEHAENDTPNWPLSDILVTSRQHPQANTIRLGGMRKRLKKLMQIWGIPPWLRDCIPVCLRNGEIVAIADWCIESTFDAELKLHRVRIQWQAEHPLLNYIIDRQHRGSNTPVLTTAVDPEGAVR